MEWISVKDRLPKESDGQVLVCMPDVFPYNAAQPFEGCSKTSRVGVAHYSEFSRLWYTGSGVFGDVQPSFWMPLPEPQEVMTK